MHPETQELHRSYTIEIHPGQVPAQISGFPTPSAPHPHPGQVPAQVSGFPTPSAPHPQPGQVPAQVSGFPTPSAPHPYAYPYPYPYPPQPPPFISPHRFGAGGQWQSGLFHCCDDPANCVITLFCPCITFGQIAEIVNKGKPSCATSGTLYGLFSLTCIACLYSCFYRSKLRAQFDLVEEPSVDCLVHCCCITCALCQEYRELNKRGFDMGIGYEANMDRQKRGITMAPIMASGMTR